MIKVLVWREVVRFLRQRSRWVGALATPALFWVLVGSGLGNSFVNPANGQEGYLEYFFPGAVLLSVLFTAIFSTISVIEDRDKGFLQGVIVSPQPSWALVLSKSLSGAILGTLQGLLLFSLVVVLPIELTILSFLQSMLLIFLMAFALTSLGFFFAWRTESVSGFHGIMNTVLMPLWLLSGSVFPVKGAESILAKLSLANPLTWGLASFRDALNGLVWNHDFFLALVILLTTSLVLIFLSSQSVSKRRGV